MMYDVDSHLHGETKQRIFNLLLFLPPNTKMVLRIMIHVITNDKILRARCPCPFSHHPPPLSELGTHNTHIGRVTKKQILIYLN